MLVSWKNASCHGQSARLNLPHGINQVWWQRLTILQPGSGNRNKKKVIFTYFVSCGQPGLREILSERKEGREIEREDGRKIGKICRRQERNNLPSFLPLVTMGAVCLGSETPS